MLHHTSFLCAQERPDVQHCLVAVDFLPAAVMRAAMLRLCAEFTCGTLPSVLVLVAAYSPAWVPKVAEVQWLRTAL